MAYLASLGSGHMDLLCAAIKFAVEQKFSAQEADKDTDGSLSFLVSGMAGYIDRIRAVPLDR
jgi:hypothetical protein